MGFLYGKFCHVCVDHAPRPRAGALITNMAALILFLQLLIAVIPAAVAQLAGLPAPLAFPQPSPPPRPPSPPPPFPIGVPYKSGSKSTASSVEYAAVQLQSALQGRPLHCAIINSLQTDNVTLGIDGFQARFVFCLWITRPCFYYIVG